jgi:hypothetical protein
VIDSISTLLTPILGGVKKTTQTKYPQRQGRQSNDMHFVSVLRFRTFGDDRDCAFVQRNCSDLRYLGCGVILAPEISLAFFVFLFLLIFLSFSFFLSFFLSFFISFLIDILDYEYNDGRRV